MPQNEPKRQHNPSATNGVGARERYSRTRRAFNWGRIEPAAIGQFVQDVTEAGCGLVLGTTSDGGALSITVLDGDERIREWPASEEDFLTFALWCKANLGDVPANKGTK